MAEKILEVKNIHKSFGKNEVLKGIDFTLDKGEVLVIIGSSGSGKTTLLRCLNFLEEADTGTISVGGETIWSAGQKQSEVEIRRNRLHFGLVFQSFNLFPQYNVLKNVTLAPELLETEALKEKCKADKSLSLKKEKKILSQKIEERARELIDTVGLRDKIDSYPCQLSGGQCQRVAIARALAMSPDILCFDEPTSALDPELTGEVLRVIRELKTADRTMIVVTHEMEFARGVGDKIIYMADGVIEEMGTPEEVFGNPKSEKTRAFLSKSAIKN
ncbi:MAG: amino acid ABC transporter ATP-binding protein [Ruminococcaceae bacterium]|nr:amino acid ABC transporter ATP-binding protein [Oscillospiraceae bacterium]